MHVLEMNWTIKYHTLITAVLMILIKTVEEMSIKFLTKFLKPKFNVSHCIAMLCLIEFTRII